MYTYSLIANRADILRSDGAVISANPRNRDFAAYLKWVIEGNKPGPAVNVPNPLSTLTTVTTLGIPVVAPSASVIITTGLEQARVDQDAAIDKACQEAMNAGFQSSASGSVYTYPTQIKDQLSLNTKVNAANIAMSAAAWLPGAFHKEGDLITAVKQAFICFKGGTSSGNPQNWNVGVGEVVDDGTCLWRIWTTHCWCKNAQNEWSLAVLTAPQIRQVALDWEAAMATILQKENALQLQIQAATDIETIMAVKWD